MTIDTNPFPSVMTNMVSISTESKYTRKETSSFQPIQQSKQVWRPKSIVVKEHTRALSYDSSKKIKKEQWRPKLEKKTRHGGQSNPL